MAAFALTVAPHYEQWIIHARYEELDCEMPLRFLSKTLTALEKEGIHYSFTDDSSLPFSHGAQAVSVLPSAPRDLLGADLDIQVFLPGRLRVPCHLEIEIDASKNGLGDVTEGEMVRLHNVIRRCAAVFKNMGVTDYMLAYHNAAFGRFKVDMIGTRPDSTKVLHKPDKADCNNWLCGIDLPSPPNLNIEAFNTPEARGATLKDLKKLFDTLPALEKPDPKATTPHKTWWQKNSHFGSYMRYLVDCIYQLLVRKGFFIERTVIRESAPDDETFSVEKTAFCPFCKPIILEKESVFRAQHWNLLYNITSSHEKGHWVLAAARPIAAYEDLTDEEIAEGLAVQQRFLRVMREKYGWSDFCRTQCQNGAAVNRTLGHFHWKIQDDFNHLRYLSYCLQRDQDDSWKVSPQDITRIVGVLKADMIIFRDKYFPQLYMLAEVDGK